MSPSLDIKVALNTLFTGLQYNGNAVPVYDVARDDGESPHVYIASLEETYNGSKSKNDYWVDLQLGISIIFDATQASMRVVDEIGELIDGRMENGNLDLGQNFTTVIQYFSGSRYAIGKSPLFVEQLKILDYRLFIHEN